MPLNNKILIVDDNPDIHQDFKLALEINTSSNNEITQALEKKDAPEFQRVRHVGGGDRGGCGEADG